MMNLEGQTALITGAGRGIGRTISVKLAESGADIVLVDMSPDVAEVRGEVESLGRKCLTFEADVTDFDAIDVMVKSAVEELGSIHILVNNAGITQDNLFMRMKPEQWSKVIDVNLNGVFNVTKAVIRPMVKQRAGKIINISSVIGITGNTGQINYAASKAGLIGMTKSTAKELASRNITANCIAPGYIQTDMSDAINKNQKNLLISKIPIGRIGAPEDIASIVQFLASDSAGFITGQTITVDGGMIL